NCSLLWRSRERSRYSCHFSSTISPLQDVFMAALLIGPPDGAATPPHDCLPARLDARARCGEKPDRYSAARMLECVEILALSTQKGLHLHAVKGDWQLDGSMQSTIIAMAFAMAAEIERELISQRTREALRVKKAAGMPLGRPRGPGKSKLDPYQPEIEALLRNGSTQTFIAKQQFPEGSETLS